MPVFWFLPVAFKPGRNEKQTPESLHLNGSVSLQCNWMSNVLKMFLNTCYMYDDDEQDKIPAFKKYVICSEKLHLGNLGYFLKLCFHYVWDNISKPNHD